MHNPHEDEPNILRDLELRDLFALFAPEPSKEEIERHIQMDRAANPHGDTYKPKRRGVLEIRANLKYEYADLMLQARRGIFERGAR